MTGVSYSIQELEGAYYTKIGALLERNNPKLLKNFREVMNGKKLSPFELKYYRKGSDMVQWGEVYINWFKVDDKKTGFYILCPYVAASG